jgi:hypothetical protein
MTTQVSLPYAVLQILMDLQISSGSLVLLLPGEANRLSKTLPKECGINHLMISNAIERPPERFSPNGLHASDLIVIMQWLLINDLWLTHIGWIQAMCACQSANETEMQEVANWLQEVARFVETNPHTKLIHVPLQPAGTAEPEGSGGPVAGEDIEMERPSIAPAPKGQVSYVLPGSIRPFVASGGKVTADHGRPTLMSEERRIEYYSGLDLSLANVSEFKSTPAEVEAMWDAIFAGLGVELEGDKRLIRADFLGYTIRNGCSPNLMTKRELKTASGRKVLLVDMFKYFADSAETLRRFMRGMADEAVAFLKANPDFVPSWGLRNMGANFDRLLAFDFADGRSDLTSQQHAQIRAVLDRILRRQADGNRRLMHMTPASGPAAGSLHRRQRRLTPRRSEFEDESGYYLEE